MKLLIATTNPGKIREYEILLDGAPAQLLSLADVGLGDMDVEENGTTIEANARIKAEAYMQASGLLTLADDTGLFVDALDGRPGVYPARYGGPGLTMPQRRAKLLGELANVADEKRTARFACVIALANPADQSVELARGICEGRIAQAEDTEGREGFGYDALFIPQGYDMPWSRVPMDEKNRISHRGQAARRVAAILERLRKISG
jgi:XTP/dITP diphosphohydrolase